MRVNVVVRPLGAPVLEHGTNHNPSKDYDEYLEKKAKKKEETWVQQTKRESAVQLLDIFNQAALSSGQQAIIIKGLNKMQEETLLILLTI